MTIDASIALGVQPLEIPSPINAFAKLQQLQGMQQQNALGALSMQERQRAMSDEAALNRIYGQAYDAEGKLDKTRLFGGMAQSNLGAKIPAVQKLLSEQEKSALETQKLQLDNAGKVVSGVASLMFNVKDQAGYDAARAAVAQQYGQPVADRLPPMYNPGEIQRRISQAMTVAEQIQQQQKAIEQQLSQEKFSWQKQHDSATLAETVRGHNLTDARARQQLALQREQLAAGKVPPGYRAQPDGSLAPIPGGPADKLGEKQTNQLVGVNNLLDAITTYQQQLKDFNLLGFMRPSDRAAMGTYYNNLMLQAKEAYNLGVLNGPDYEIMTDMLTDPRSGKGLILSRADMKRQTDALAGIIRRLGQNLEQRRPGLNPEMPASLQTPFNHPPDIQNLLQKYSGSGTGRPR